MARYSIEVRSNFYPALEGEEGCLLRVEHCKRRVMRTAEEKMWEGWRLLPDSFTVEVKDRADGSVDLRVYCTVVDPAEPEYPFIIPPAPAFAPVAKVVETPAPEQPVTPDILRALLGAPGDGASEVRFTSEGGLT